MRISDWSSDVCSSDLKDKRRRKETQEGEAPMASTAPPEVAGAAQRVGRYRWVICGLLFAATAINYVDRQMIGVLKPTLQEEFGWTEVDFAAIVFWFQVASALGYLRFGRVVDRVGARLASAMPVLV